VCTDPQAGKWERTALSCMVFGCHGIPPIWAMQQTSPYRQHTRQPTTHQKQHSPIPPAHPHRLDEALMQNSIADIMTTDLDQLGDDEAEGLGPSSSGGGTAAAGGRSSTAAAAAAGGAAAGGGGGHRQGCGGLTEAQSFTDLAYSKNKVCKSLFLCPHLTPDVRWVVSLRLYDEGKALWSGCHSCKLLRSQRLELAFLGLLLRCICPSHTHHRWCQPSAGCPTGVVWWQRPVRTLLARRSGWPPWGGCHQHTS